MQTVSDLSTSTSISKMEFRIEPAGESQRNVVRFPQLLALRFHNGYQPVVKSLLNGFLSALQLHKLDIHPRHFDFMLDDYRTATLCKHLTFLTLGSKSNDVEIPLAFLALAAMPNLKQCVLYLFLHATQDVQPPIVMKSLLSLELYSMSTSFGQTQYFLSPLTLLSLKTLKVNTPSNPSPVSQLIQRSRYCYIRTLVIQVPEKNGGDLSSMLQHMAELECLTIGIVQNAPSRDDSSVAFFKPFIIATDDEDVLCPSLERLCYEMHNIDLTAPGIQTLIRLKRSRSMAALTGDIALLRFLSIQLYSNYMIRWAEPVDVMDKIVRTKGKGLDELWNVCHGEQADDDDDDAKTDLELVLYCGGTRASYCFDSKSWTELPED